MSETRGNGGVSVLVVDDEPVVQDVLSCLLERAGHQALVATTGQEGIDKAREWNPDIVFLDVMLPDRNGIDVLNQLHALNREQPVIMMTAYGSVENAVEAMKQGAYHYLTKPFSNDEVLLLIDKALDNRRLREENRLLRSLLSGEDSFESIIGRSRVIREVFRLVEQIAPTRETVLILGESGTGKELVARALHNRSPRSEGPFVSVNCGSIPPELLESNLFGHLKGAFTGATNDHAGLFQAAESGTIFLDEIGTLRPDLQSKLLRVIQERSFIPVGATADRHVDVRILAATNDDLEMLVERSEFREDLYYRLNVLRIELPPLRGRREDIGLLAEHFLKKHALENGKTLAGIETDAMETLVGHAWPGNVRQLENAIIQAVVLSSGETLARGDLPAEVRDERRRGPEPVLPAGLSLGQAMLETEKKLIADALERAEGVQRRAAELLRIRPTTLNEKMKRLGLKNGG